MITENTKRKFAQEDKFINFIKEMKTAIDSYGTKSFIKITKVTKETGYGTDSRMETGIYEKGFFCNKTILYTYASPTHSYHTIYVRKKYFECIREIVEKHEDEWDISFKLKAGRWKGK